MMYPFSRKAYLRQDFNDSINKSGKNNKSPELSTDILQGHRQFGFDDQYSSFMEVQQLYFGEG